MESRIIKYRSSDRNKATSKLYNVAVMIFSLYTTEQNPNKRSDSKIIAIYSNIRSFLAVWQLSGGFEIAAVTVTTLLSPTLIPTNIRYVSIIHQNEKDLSQINK